MSHKKKISQHISYSEAIRSYTAIRDGIDNIPDSCHLANMTALAIFLFEPLRIWAKVPIYISSFFRSFKLNIAVGGVDYSDHLALNKRCSIDIDADVYGGITNRELFEYIRDNLEFDKLIWEHGDDENPDWVHVSFSRVHNRKILLKVSIVDGLKQYNLL